MCFRTPLGKEVKSVLTGCGASVRRDPGHLVYAAHVKGRLAKTCRCRWRDASALGASRQLANVGPRNPSKFITNVVIRCWQHGKIISP
jgi:hypothetical protein